MKRTSAVSFTLAAIGVILLQIATRQAVAAPAAIFTVNSFVDAPDDLLTPGTCQAYLMPPGTCTLRAAVMQANRASGVPRALDGNGDGLAICDVGAFEYRPPLYLPLIQR